MVGVIVLKLIGAVALGLGVVLAIVVYDVGWNGGALFYRFAGRASLEAACTPPLRADLLGRGFSPVELVFGDTPSIASVAGSFGRSRSLAETFTFVDGDAGPRVDGRMLCTLRGNEVKVDLKLDELPRRVT